MSVATSHQISRYYDFFRDKEVVFTKANIKSLRLDPRQIYIKCNGGQWPCIINSTSLQQAKIIIGTSSGVYTAITKKSDSLNLSIRYCFFNSENNPVQFFVNCTVDNVQNYQGSNELALVSLNFSQRPPDDLIKRIGEFVEVNENFKTRKEERIAINKNTLRELNIPKEESVIFISNVPRRCILKDISFGGARIMFVGIPKFLVNKSIDLRFFFNDNNEKVSVLGTIINAEFLPGRQDIVIAHIQYNPDEIPMSYKFRINRYLTSYQKQLIDNQIQNDAKAKKAEEAAAAEKKALEEKRNANMKADPDANGPKIDAKNDAIKESKEKVIDTEKADNNADSAKSVENKAESKAEAAPEEKSDNTENKIDDSKKETVTANKEPAEAVSPEKKSE